MRDSRELLVVADGLSKQYGTVRAVHDVTLTLRRGEVVGLVGESGSGKTTVGRMLLHLVKPTGGKIVFDGADLDTIGSGSLRALRRRMQMIFQDPFSSLNPYMRIGDAIKEPLVVHGLRKGREDREERVVELLERVGLRQTYARRYPHELSGGQRQRVAIARALASEPDFIVADEAVSALDVSIQAQIVNLLKSLQSALQLTMLFISHDLRVVRYLSDRIIVMYLGRVVESGTTDDIFSRPSHPYTRALLSAIPDLNATRRDDRIVLSGDAPSPVRLPGGCVFRERCPFAIDACAGEEPLLRPISATHVKACIRDDLAG